MVTRDGRSDRELIQVCWSLADEATRARELRGLHVALEEIRATWGTIVTWLDEDRSDDRVIVVPAWKWLLTKDEANTKESILARFWSSS